jgi:hypothetical protein
MLSLDDLLDRAQGQPRDVLDEPWTDDVVGDYVADHRPGRVKPMVDGNMHSL